MSFERSAGRNQLNEVIRRAQKSLDINQLLGRDGQTPLIFEIMHRGGENEERHMKPYVHPNVLPKSDKGVEEVLDLLEENSQKLSIEETWPEQKKDLEEVRTSTLKRKKVYLDRLLDRYEKWKIPTDFAATGLLYNAWQAYGLDSTTLEESGLGQGDGAPPVSQDEAFMMEIEEGESTEALLGRMGRKLGFRITGDGNPVNIEGANHSGELILPPDLLTNGNGREDLDPEYVEELRLYNWIEYSVIHRLVYGYQDERRILSHFPLIADNCWFLGFAYCFVKSYGDKRDLAQLREYRSKNQKGAFDTFASFNLRNALIIREIDKLSEEREDVFTSREDKWEHKKHLICEEVLRGVLCCYNWDEKEDDDEIDINIVPRIKDYKNLKERNIYGSLRSIIKYIEDKIYEKRQRLRGGRLHFYDKAFKSLEHFLPNVRSKSAHTNRELNAKALFFEVFAYSVRQMVFPNRVSKEYDSQEIIDSLRGLFGDIISKYDVSCEECMISPASARLLYEIIYNEWDHEKGISGINWRTGMLTIENEYISLKHTKEVYLKEAISMCQKIIGNKSALMGNDELGREGIPLILDLVDFLGGTAKWLFYKNNSSENIICDEFEGILLKAPDYIFEGEEISYAEATSEKIDWELSLEFPSNK